MLRSRGIGRLGGLAVGLGIGAALAATPGVASADPVSPLDPNVAAASVDGVTGTLGTAAADPAAGPDIAISFSGIPLLQQGTATAHSSFGDLAIALGAKADAEATGGFGDFASAFSTGTAGVSAIAGDPTGTTSGNNFDFASAFGNDIVAGAGNPIGTPAGFSILPSSFDFASAVGSTCTLGVTCGAFAGVNGNFDFASAVGQNVVAGGGFGTNFPVGGGPSTPANFDSATVLGNLFTAPSGGTEADAGGMSGVTGSVDNAFVVDPFATMGSTADAGFGATSALGNFDLAGALGDMLHAIATGGNFLIDIPPFI
jgi:hypothetical protein